MQARRVILLFALVLGMSAVVASLAPPPERGKESKTTSPPALGRPQAAPTLSARAIQARFRVAKPVHRRVPTGSSVEVVVEVPAPGDVTLDGLGLREFADPRSPARFEILAEHPARHRILFVPVTGEPQAAGKLVVER